MAEPERLVLPARRAVLEQRRARRLQDAWRKAVYLTVPRAVLVRAGRAAVAAGVAALLQAKGGRIGVAAGAGVACAAGVAACGATAGTGAGALGVWLEQQPAGASGAIGFATGAAGTAGATRFHRELARRWLGVVRQAQQASSARPSQRVLRFFFRFGYRFHLPLRLRRLPEVLAHFSATSTDRARVRLLFRDAVTGQQVNDSFSLDLEFAGQLVNSNLIWRPVMLSVLTYDFASSAFSASPSLPAGVASASASATVSAAAGASSAALAVSEFSAVSRRRSFRLLLRLLRLELPRSQRLRP